MAYCRKCGKEIFDEAVICPHCGVPQNLPKQGSDSIADDGNIVWLVIGFILPVIGLLLFLYWKDTKPYNAEQLKKGCIVGFIVFIIALMIIDPF